MMWPEKVIASLMMQVDDSGGPTACHRWQGQTHRRGTPFTSIPGFDYHANPRRVLFEQHHGVRLVTSHRVNSWCKDAQCCNVLHLFGGEPALRMACLVDSSGGPDACWPYRGARDHHGYGRLAEGRTSKGKRRFAHRWAYELANGPLVDHLAHTDDEILIMHTCDNPPCCNPKHLRAGTDRDNIHDMLAKGRAGWQKQRLLKMTGTGGAGEAPGPAQPEKKT